MENYQNIYAIDTNIILNDAHNLYTLSQDGSNLIIIPETVLDEIDSKKSGFDEKNYQAREFARMLDDMQMITETTYDNIKTITCRTVDDITFVIVTKDVYRADGDIINIKNYNDRKILEVITDIQELDLYSNLKFITLDLMAKTRAYSLSIKTETLQLNAKDEALEHFKTIDLEEEPKTVNDIIEHKDETFSYEVRLPDGNRKYYVVKGINLEEIKDSFFNAQTIKPKNIEQKLFSTAILDEYYNVIISNAKAGSGKTLLAISGAIAKVKNKKTDYNQIVYIRNSIESLDKGEDVGYLPGLEEKFKIYNHPLYDCIDMIALQEIKSSNKNKKNSDETELNKDVIQDKADELISSCNIETMWIGEMRGRTLSNAIVIIDEAQNMSNKSIQTALTRIDSSCKVIIIGSNNQVDNMYLNKHINGMTTVINSSKVKTDLVNLFVINLGKVLRGAITEWAETTLSK